MFTISKLTSETSWSNFQSFLYVVSRLINSEGDIFSGQNIKY